MFHHWYCSSSVVSFFLYFTCQSFLLLVSLAVTHHVREHDPTICFHFVIVLMIQRTSSTLFSTSMLPTFAVQLIFFIFLHNHISNASILLISVLDIVDLSAAYKATLQTRHLTGRLFTSRFFLPVIILLLFVTSVFVLIIEVSYVMSSYCKHVLVIFTV